LPYPYRFDGAGKASVQNPGQKARIPDKAAVRRLEEALTQTKLSLNQAVLAHTLTPHNSGRKGFSPYARDKNPPLGYASRKGNNCDLAVAGRA